MAGQKGIIAILYEKLDNDMTPEKYLLDAYIKHCPMVPWKVLLDSGIPPEGLGGSVRILREAGVFESRAAKSLMSTLWRAGSGEDFVAAVASELDEKLAIAFFSEARDRSWLPGVRWFCKERPDIAEKASQSVLSWINMMGLAQSEDGAECMRILLERGVLSDSAAKEVIQAAISNNILSLAEAMEAVRESLAVAGATGDAKAQSRKRRLGSSQKQPD